MATLKGVLFMSVLLDARSARVKGSIHARQLHRHLPAGELGPRPCPADGLQSAQREPDGEGVEGEGAAACALLVEVTQVAACSLQILHRTLEDLHLVDGSGKVG